MTVWSNTLRKNSPQSGCPIRSHRQRHARSDRGDAGKLLRQNGARPLRRARSVLEHQPHGPVRQLGLDTRRAAVSMAEADAGIQHDEIQVRLPASSGRRIGHPQRGGSEAAKFHEWGGASANGSNDCAQKRPGWEMPIHQLLLKNKVSAVSSGTIICT